MPDVPTVYVPRLPAGFSELAVDKYILEADGRTFRRAYDLLEWGEWFESSGDQRIVARTEIGGVRVSTVFLGLDHNFRREGPPILFETLVFGGPLDQEQERYATYEEAEAGHRRMVRRVRAAHGPLARLDRWLHGGSSFFLRWYLFTAGVWAIVGLILWSLGITSPINIPAGLFAFSITYWGVFTVIEATRWLIRWWRSKAHD